MKENSLNALIITSKDEFLNDYVDKSTCLRTFLSGFNGSAGDLFITLDNAYLLVDGRYHTQAEYQVDKNIYTIEKVGIDDEGNRINELLQDRHIKIIQKLSRGKNLITGYDPRQFSVKMLSYMREKINAVTKTTVFTPLSKTFLDEIKLEPEKKELKPVYTVPEEISGLSALKKLQIVRQKFNKLNINALFLTKLDEVSYITNLRSDEIELSSSFKGYLFISNNEAFIFSDPEKFGCTCLKQMYDGFSILSIKDMEDTLRSYISRQEDKFHIGYDPTSTTCALQEKLNTLISKQCKIIALDINPVKKMKAIKNDVELEYIKKCLQKADNAFKRLIEQVNTDINAGKILTENDIKQKILMLFKAYGGYKPSFEVISATGKNTAIVHYTAASEDEKVHKNSLVLLDSGTYFQGGYATDLTRTFVAGGCEARPDEKLKRIYTIVLKASIRGLRAEIPPDSDGVYLDGIVRSIITNYGFDYNHGTGHGIGICVHESPPSIIYGLSGSIKLKKNMVFSIEPGIYLEGWGGVRIENIVTLADHPDKEGWLIVKCLTYAPLDENLIDFSMLNNCEKAFVEDYKRNFVDIPPEKL